MHTTDSRALYYFARVHVRMPNWWIADVYSDKADVGYLWHDGDNFFDTQAAVDSAASAQGLSTLPDRLKEQFLK